MQGIISVVQLVIIVLFPWATISLCNRFKVLKTLGPVFICYAAGFLISMLPLPEMDRGFGISVSEVLVPLAIPMLLISVNISHLRHMAKSVSKGFVIIVVSVLIVASGSYFLFGHMVPEAAKISAMLTGVYVGGTTNLIAIGYSLNVSDTLLVLTNTADLIAGGLYLFMLLSFLGPLLRKFLPKFQSVGMKDAALAEEMASTYDDAAFKPTVKNFLRLIPVFLAAAAAVGISLGASFLVSGGINAVIVMLGVTTMGIAYSFIKRLRETQGSFHAGQYLIYMFSIAMGMAFDISLINLKTINILFYLLIVQFGSVLLGMIIAKVVKLDADTTIITSTACIFGPPFIMPVANALKNRELILPGLICGVLGHAIANYLGYAVYAGLTFFS
ncbi:MAG: DUF819 family protein [Christensenellales bacterium]|jgi:uncharacterized membrane protein